MNVAEQLYPFLVDSGAAVSIIPKNIVPSNCLQPTDIRLSTVDGSPLIALGTITLKVGIRRLRREFTWKFVVTSSTEYILGADFLTFFNLSIDMKNKSIQDSSTGICTACKSTDNFQIYGITKELPPDVPESVIDIIDRNSGILEPQKYSDRDSQPVKKQTQYYHRIKLSCDEPVFSKPRPLHPEKLRVAKAVFEGLLADGIIEPSDSPYASPLHMVPKKEPNSWRPTGDYRRLNQITTADRYATPNITTCTAMLQGTSIYSKLDLTRAFHCIPMHPDDIPKTAITTPFGSFQFKYMPFGLKNASASHQRYMDQIFRDLDFVTVYIDDILIASPDEQTHLKHLETVLHRLNEHNMKVNIHKCEFLKNKITFLGFEISAEGFRPSPVKSEILKSMEPPKSYTTLRSQIGMFGYYRRFIPEYASIVAPLQELINISQPTKGRKSPPFNWTNDHQSAYEKLKDSLAHAITLHHPSSECSNYSIYCDASQTAIGAVIHEETNNEQFPLSFYSRLLTKPERQWSTFDRELLAAYCSVKKFKHIIEGRTVTVYTDHKPLADAFKSSKEPTSPKQSRQLSFLAEYVDQVIYVKGQSNIVADCLSRPNAKLASVSIDLFDLENLADEQEKDDLVGDLKAFPLPSGKQIHCDTSLPEPRPFIPPSLRKQIFSEFHQLSHPGKKGTFRLLQARFVWPDMRRDVNQWCKSCEACQKNKITRHTKTPIGNFPPSMRFQCVHIDIVGPLPISSDTPCRYLLTMIDRTTNWIEATPIKSITAEETARAFNREWISRFGVPLKVITDRGSQFESQLFHELQQICGFQRIRTTAYHPQANGKIERMHRTIKQAIRAKGQDWHQCLPSVLLSIRMLPRENQEAPFSLVTGSKPQMPSALFTDKANLTNEYTKDLAKHFKELPMHEDVSTRNIQTYQSKDLNNCSRVWIRIDRIKAPLEAPYIGPFKVLQRSPKVFTIEKADGSHDTISIDRLKPFYDDSTNSTFNSPATHQRSSTTPQVSQPRNMEEHTNAAPNPQSENTPKTRRSTLPSTPTNHQTDTRNDDTMSPTTTTRSGRRVRFTRNNQYHYFR